MAASTIALADTSTPKVSIICQEKGNTYFSIQLKIGAQIGNRDSFLSPIYTAEFTSLHGPRLAGVKYNVQVVRKTISTRLQTGYSYSASIPDGSQLYIEYLDGGSGYELESFKAILNQRNDNILYFNCNI